MCNVSVSVEFTKLLVPFLPSTLASPDPLHFMEVCVVLILQEAVLCEYTLVREEEKGEWER